MNLPSMIDVNNPPEVFHRCFYSNHLRDTIFDTRCSTSHIVNGVLSHHCHSATCVGSARGNWETEKKHRYPNQFFTHGANILFQTSASRIDGKIYQIDHMLLSNISQDNIFSTVRATQISMRSMRTKSQDKDCSMYVTCFHDPQRVAWFIAASGIHVKTF